MATGGRVMLLLLSVLVVTEIEALSPPSINYCRNRFPSECCREGRDDNCSVPIRDTLCYCDSFCLEDDPDVGPHDDCCPDYREVCSGQPSPDPLVLCSDDSGARSVGKYTDNCNQCMCADGRVTCEEELCMVDEEVIRRVNGNPWHYGWTATNYSAFWGRKAKEGLFLRTGTLIPDNKMIAMLPISLSPDPRRIPPEFDARHKTEWRGLISGVRDQGWCGASWAFSTLGVAQDRQMILTRGQKLSLAPQHLLSCSGLPMEGCKGGHIDGAWNYMRKYGVVEDQCFPFTSGVSGKVPYCPMDPDFLSCKMYKMEPAYRISGKEEDIQWEVMTNGPVQAVMWVKRDFFMYSSGVYRCPQMTGKQTGLHSVRIIGWGSNATLNGAPSKYWLVANSWGTDWGEGGFFRIQRGKNECGIESFVLATRGRNDNGINGKGF